MILTYLLSFLTIILVTSCRRNEVVDLERIDAEVRVTVMWENGLVPEGVSGMMVYFYPLDSRNLKWRFSVDASGESKITIPCGRYEVIAVNSDVSGVAYGDADRMEAFSAILNKRLTPPSGIRSDAPFMQPPGIVYRAKATEVEVTPCGIRYRTESGEMEGCTKDCRYSLLRLYPEDVMCRYRVVVHRDKGWSEIKSVSASLSGMAESLLLSGVKCGERSVTLPFTMSEAIEEPGMEGGFLTFGCVRTERMILNLYITYVTGKRCLYSTDVTNQVLNSEDLRNVYIYIKDLNLENPDTPPDIPGDGFGVDIEGWDEIIIDYEFP